MARKPYSKKHAVLSGFPANRPLGRRFVTSYYELPGNPEPGLRSSDSQAPVEQLFASFQKSLTLERRFIMEATWPFEEREQAWTEVLGISRVPGTAPPKIRLLFFSQRSLRERTAIGDQGQTHKTPQCYPHRRVRDKLNVRVIVTFLNVEMVEDGHAVEKMTPNDPACPFHVPPTETPPRLNGGPAGNVALSAHQSRAQVSGCA